MRIDQTTRSMLQVTQTPHIPGRRAPDNGKLRILHVVPTYFPAVRYGGPIRSVHALAQALVARGHEVHVFTSSVDGPGNLDVPHGTPVDLDGVQVRYFPVRFMRRLYWCPSLAHALRRVIDSFDVVHLHSVFLWPTWAAARIARRAGTPYVVSPRGMLGAEVVRREIRLVKSAWIRLIEQRTVERRPRYMSPPTWSGMKFKDSACAHRRSTRSRTGSAGLRATSASRKVRSAPSPNRTRCF